MTEQVRLLTPESAEKIEKKEADLIRTIANLRADITLLSQKNQDQANAVGSILLTNDIVELLYNKIKPKLIDTFEDHMSDIIEDRVSDCTDEKFEDFRRYGLENQIDDYMRDANYITEDDLEDAFGNISSDYSFVNEVAENVAETSNFENMLQEILDDHISKKSNLVTHNDLREYAQNLTNSININ